MRKLFLLVYIVLGVASAQENIPLLNQQSQKYNTSLEKLYQSRSVISHTVPQVLESALDEELYIVGPGDQFKVSVFGELENTFEFTVLPGGTVLIPTIGEYKVSGLTLQEVNNKLLSEVKKNYIRADIRVNLTGLRKFRVYYTGEVNAPGTYFAQGSDRLSDIVEISIVENQKISINTSQTSITTSISDWGDDTNIIITHKNGKRDYYDLTRFYRQGDISQNPLLAGGDIIYVPSINLREAYVTIEGNVGFEGIYPLKQDEGLFDFLKRVNAIDKRSNLKNVIVERSQKKESLDILNNADKVLHYKLQAFDKIIIPSIYNEVYVKGEVIKPGAFPYLANYTVRDYVGKAGALDSADELDDIYIIRQTTGEVFEGSEVIVEKGDTIVVPKRMREVFKDYATILIPIVSIVLSALILVK